MEKQIALVRKSDNRVVNVFIVESLDKDSIKAFATDELEVVAVAKSIPYINGLWDGKEFIAPTIDYLVEIGACAEPDYSVQDLPIAK
jgi:hypothetical protein